MQQHYAELDCLHNVEHASNTLQSQHNHQDLLSASSSAAPTPELQRVRTNVEGTRSPPIWKDLPPAIMTESIGPLEDICILPDDPMITSIYIHDSVLK